MIRKRGGRCRSTFRPGSHGPGYPKSQNDQQLSRRRSDGLRKSHDEKSFLQRHTPRQKKSIWSQVNRDHVARLTKAGRMTPHGQRQIDAAKADGRWAAAYAPIRSASADSIPPDLRKAINANARAEKMFTTLGRMNLFALTFRTNNMKTPAGRARKIGALVDMLANGKTIVPETR